MSRHHRGKPDKAKLAEPVSAEAVLKHLGWCYAVVYDYGEHVAIHDVYIARVNAENDAESLNAERGDGCRCYKVAPIRGVTAQ